MKIPRRNRRDAGPLASALGELEGTSCLRAPILLAFHHARVARQELLRTHGGAQFRFELDQGAGDAVTNGAGLADTGVWSASDLALIRRLHPKDVRVPEPADKPQEPEEPQVEEPQEPQEPLSRIEQIFDAINATVSG